MGENQCDFSKHNSDFTVQDNNGVIEVLFGRNHVSLNIHGMRPRPLCRDPCFPRVLLCFLVVVFSILER